MGAETNVVADVSQFNHFLDQISSILMNMYSKAGIDSSKRAELNKKCHDILVGKNASEASMKIISNKYEKAIENYLLNHDIPHFCVPTGGGQTTFIVPGKYENDLLDAQKAAGYISTDFIMQCNPLSIAESAKDIGYSHSLNIECKDERIAEIAKQKLYQSHITCGVITKDGESTTIVAHPNGLYRADGPDLAKFRLFMAVEEAKGAAMFCDAEGKSPYLDSRLAQAEHDKKDTDEFTKKCMNGESSVLCDPTGKSNVYIETVRGNVNVYTRDKSGEWEKMKLDIGKDAAADDIKNLISAYSDKVYNMAEMDANVWRNKFINGQVQMNKEEPKKTDPDYLAYHGMYADGQNNKSRPKIDKSFAKIDAVAKKELDPLINAISVEACKKVNNELGAVRTTDTKQMKAAYDLELKYMKDFLTDEKFGPVKQFINSNGGVLTAEQRKQWLKNIADSLDGGEIAKSFTFEVKERKLDKAFFKELKEAAAVRTTAKATDKAKSAENEVEHDTEPDIGTDRTK